MMRRVLFGLLCIAMSLQAEDVYATFTVEAEKSANLAFTASGIVKNVTIDIASVVKKGDVLAELENDDIKASLNIATTALSFAKKEYERQKKVEKLVDASRLDTYAYKYENAKAQLIYQQALLEKTILKAPFDGIIFDKLVEVGDVVSGAMIRTVLKMQSTKARKLIVSFDQKYWKVVKVGEVFEYRIDGDTKRYSGKITKIYPASDSKNRKMRAEVITEGFLVGLFGEGMIKIPDVK
ncbi:MAG: efflux RND transporter periplasmic adaptor subunit [Sulfurimonas sp.]